MNIQSILFYFEGYELIIDQENSTCTKSNSNEIYGYYHDESACRTKCDENMKCGFFFVNPGSWCALYKSCNERRGVKNVGRTFRKRKGTNLLGSFLFTQFSSKCNSKSIF